MKLDSLGYEHFGSLSENLFTQMASASPLYTIKICIYPKSE